LVIGNHIFWEVQKIIQDNQRLHIPSSFYQWLGATYCSHTSMGVRRQLDRDPRSISLQRLLWEIKQSPCVLSREKFRSIYKPLNFTAREQVELADKCFDGYAGQNEDHLPVGKIERDLADLQALGHKVRMAANKIVAHLDQTRPTTLPTFGELDDCVKLLERLVLKYEMLFNASAPHSLLPTWQCDWKAIFYEPWIARH
jgi:hypothetical protein